MANELRNTAIGAGLILLLFKLRGGDGFGFDWLTGGNSKDGQLVSMDMFKKAQENAIANGVDSEHKLKGFRIEIPSGAQVVVQTIEREYVDNKQINYNSNSRAKVSNGETHPLDDVLFKNGSTFVRTKRSCTPQEFTIKKADGSTTTKQGSYCVTLIFGLQPDQLKFVKR